MTRSTFLLRRLAIGLVGFVFVAGICLSEAQAASVQHSMTGNGRAQIGDGLPIPIGFTAEPTGKIAAIPGAVVTQTQGVDPVSLLIPPGQLKYGNILPSPAAATITGADSPKQVLGVFNTNPAVLEVATQVAIYGGGVGTFPAWKAGGRTGAATVTFCPGDVVTPSGNPGCPNGIAGGPINGLMTYTKTAAQFGGPGQSRVGGFATVALFAGGTVPSVNPTTPQPPGTVTALFALANPSSKGAGGAPFGFVNATTGAAPTADSRKGVFKVLSNGQLLTKLATIASATGVTNPGTEYGAPWTTGRVTVQVTLVAALPETFTLTGSDMRVGGVGNISLVSGSVSTRLISSGQANRGWTNLTIGEMIVPTPSMSSHSLAAVFGLLALAGGYVLDRRRRVRS